MELIQRLEKLIIRRGAVGEDFHRRRYLAWCVLIFVPTLTVFAWFDFVRGDRTVALLIMAVVGVLLASLGIIHSARDIRWGYRLVFTGSIGLLSSIIFLGGGEGYAVMWVYFLPPAIYYVFGTREGTAWFLSTLVIAAAILLTDFGVEYPSGLGARFVVSYSIVGAFALGLQQSRERLFAQLEAEKKHLEDALAEVKTLSEMLPMCAWCGNVRDDEGYWSRIEEYLGNRTGTQVSHGVCPPCRDKVLMGHIGKGA